MSEIGKYPLDDEDLEKVSGGVNAAEAAPCGGSLCERIDMTKPETCSNCRLSGSCPFGC